MVTFPFINWNNGVLKQCVAASIASIAMFMMGAGFAWVSGTMLQLDQTDDEIGWLVALNHAMASVFLFPFYKLSDFIGRRSVLQMAAFFNLTAYIIISAVPYDYGLYVGRTIKGISTGAVLSSLPQYLMEISCPSIRVALGHLAISLWYLGAVFSSSIGPFVSKNVYSITSTLPAVVYSAAAILVPESPRYYLTRGQDLKALKALTWLRGGLDSAQKEYDSAGVTDKHTGWEYAFQSTKAIYLVCVVASLHAFLAPALLAYTPLVLYSLLKNTTATSALLIVQTIACFVASSCSFIVVEKYRRRRILLWACFIAIIVSALPATYMLLHHLGVVHLRWPFVLVAIFYLIYPIISSLTFQPVTYTLAHELFHPQSHSEITIILNLLACISTAVSCKVMQVFITYIGSYVALYITTFLSFVGLIVIYFALPETKDKCYIDIKEMLN